jgi:hypothetical protein
LKDKDLREFIRAYGERGYYVLKAILEAFKENWGRGALGDFDFKSVRKKIESYGLDYNPALLLSRLEKEFGVIETTYKSTNQHWWRIVDLNAIEEVLAEYEGRDLESLNSLPPRARLLRIQFYSLDPEKVLATLKKAQRGFKLPRRLLEEIIFVKLPKIVDFLEKAYDEFPEELMAEISLAEEILNLAERLVLSSREVGSNTRSRLAREVDYDSLL